MDKAAGTASSTVNELSHLLNAGSAQFTKLTQSGMNDLEKFLHISSKTSTLKPSLNLEAQVLNGDVMPAAIPEPSTWIVFAALITGAAMLRKRLSLRVCNEWLMAVRNGTGQGQRGDRPAAGCRRDELVGTVGKTALEVSLKRTAPRFDVPRAVVALGPDQKV